MLPLYFFLLPFNVEWLDLSSQSKQQWWKARTPFAVCVIVCYWVCFSVHIIVLVLNSSWKMTSRILVLKWWQKSTGILLWCPSIPLHRQPWLGSWKIWLRYRECELKRPRSCQYVIIKGRPAFYWHLLPLNRVEDSHTRVGLHKTKDINDCCHLCSYSVQFEAVTSFNSPEYWSSQNWETQWKRRNRVEKAATVIGCYVLYDH